MCSLSLSFSPHSLTPLQGPGPENWLIELQLLHSHLSAPLRAPDPSKIVTVAVHLSTIKYRVIL